MTIETQADGPGMPAPGEPATTRLRSLFDAALELDLDQRAAFVARETGDDPGLRGELESLLRHHDVLGGFLARPSTPAPPTASAGRAHDPPWFGPGERIGEHEILGLLGRGGGGQVYRARQASLDRVVALKVVRTGALGAGERERFLRGARIAAAIHHPHLVEIFDCGEDLEHGFLYYSMRLVEGCTLQQVLDRSAGQPPGAPARRGLVRRLLEVADALAVLHRRGIIHQDIKPANILLDGAPGATPWSGSAVLVDFGLLRNLAKTGNSTVWATLPYAAPEVLLLGRVDERADVYALGLCLYDLVSGSSAVRRDKDQEHASRLSCVVPGVEPDLEAVIHRAIDPSAARRYPDAGALAADLRAFLAGEPVRARRLTRIERARRWVRQHPERVLGWAVRGGVQGTALLLISAGIGFLVQSFSHVRGARAAWEAGDLQRAQHQAALLPNWARELTLGPELGRMPAEDGSPDTPAGEVLRALSREDPRAAVMLAARYLERDGLGPHPELTRFLVHALRTRRPAPEQGTDPVVRLLARFFLEQPALTAIEIDQTAPLRALLEERLRAREAPESDRLHAASALGGCGDLESIAALLRWLEQEAGSAGAGERLRIVLEAWAAMARRSVSAGFGEQLAALDWDDRLARALATVDAPTSGELQHSAGLASILNLCRSAHGRPALRTEAHDSTGMAELALLATGHDPRFPERLKDVFLDLNATRASHWTAHYEALGLFVAVYGDAALTRYARQTLASGSDSGSDRGRLHLAAFEEALASGVKGFMRWGRAQPDPESRLGAWFDRRRQPWIEHPSSRGHRLPTEGLAEWWFGDATVWQHGLASGLATRAAELVPEDWTSGFLRLATFGVSEARFRLRTNAETPDALRLRLRCQKGRRGPLPHSGRAVIEVVVDGPVQRQVVDHESSVMLDIPFTVPRRGEECVVSVRLTDESTTTFRIYYAEILGPSWR